MKIESQSIGIAALAACLVVMSSVLPGAEKPLVYVAPLPSGAHASATADLVRELRSALERRGVRNLAGPAGPTAAALEAITSASNAAGAQVSVGIRLVPSQMSCATVRTPFILALVPKPTRRTRLLRADVLAINRVLAAVPRMPRAEPATPAPGGPGRLQPMCPPTSTPSGCHARR